MTILVKVPMDNKYKKIHCFDSERVRDRKEDDLDERYKEEIERANRVYYSYYTWSYEWWWDAIFLCDGKRWYADLWHCSCYWPTRYTNKELCEHTIEDALAMSKFTEWMKEFILKDWK